MDCPEEVAILKRQLSPLVGGEDRLSFDILNAKMSVLVSDAAVTSGAVCQGVAVTGMRAVPWEEVCQAGVCAVEAGFWRQRSRLLLCVTSALLLTLGLILEGIHHGGIAFLLKDAGQPEGLPSPPVLVCYAGAMIAGGWYVVPKAWVALRSWVPDMNLLMMVAVAGAVAIGQWSEAASVTFLFSLALLLESWSTDRARRAIRSLLELSPTVARFVCPHDGCVEERPVNEIAVGTTILVRPGEKIPLDGVIVKGETAVNQASITGESLPVAKGVGSEVFAGTINGDGAFEFRSSKPATDTTLARIIHMVEESQSRRAPAEQWVERFARVYTPIMMLLALLIAVLPPLLTAASWSAWFYNGLVLLVIACPCALVISTPVSIVAALTSATRHGVLIKGGAYLEALGRIRALAMDKTGTVTRGQTRVHQVIPLDDHRPEQLLAHAAAMERHTTHPLGLAIGREAVARDLQVPHAEEFTALPGEGAQAKIHGRQYWIGSHRMLERRVDEPADLHDHAVQLENAGHSLVFMWCDDHICGLISVADELREDVPQVLQELRTLGILKVVLVTGDNRGTAEAIAGATGVDEWQAELLPEDKVAVVNRLRQEFGQVAMVGDGVNDAPALAAATVGIAMGTIGTDAAIETADVALMSDDLSRLPWLIRHSRRTLAIIRQNVVFALGLKGLFVGMALFGMATLWLAIAADMGASLLVIFNGLRLLRNS
ncbi:MAG TPA: heavy metal translocating P-type ATPase [Syntrophobacteraceae bacterium]|nr:heavy metal translocating P-type ATPase [Syntrophobacteraceae bacterium]